jgi:hypothetical protein
MLTILKIRSAATSLAGGLLGGSENEASIMDSKRQKQAAPSKKFKERAGGGSRTPWPATSNRQPPTRPGRITEGVSTPDLTQWVSLLFGLAFRSGYNWVFQAADFMERSVPGGLRLEPEIQERGEVWSAIHCKRP